MLRTSGARNGHFLGPELFSIIFHKPETIRSEPVRVLCVCWEPDSICKRAITRGELFEVNLRFLWLLIPEEKK